MVKKVSTIFILILISIHGICQSNINKFCPRISFSIPDSTYWKQVTDSPFENNMKGVLMYKHLPILDSMGNAVQPVIAIVYEKVDVKMDALVFSLNALGQKAYHLNYDLLGGYPDFSSDKYSVVYKGVYERSGVKHKVMLGYIFRDSIGIEIIGDSTEELYPQVEKDIVTTIKSLYIRE